MCLAKETQKSSCLSKYDTTTIVIGILLITWHKQKPKWQYHVLQMRMWWQILTASKKKQQLCKEIFLQSNIHIFYYDQQNTSLSLSYNRRLHVLIYIYWVFFFEVLPKFLKRLNCWVQLCEFRRFVPWTCWNRRSMSIPQCKESQEFRGS